MKKSMKTILLWWLLFAFPFQGFAASSMLFCKSSHHALSVASIEAAGSGMQQSDHHGNANHHAMHDHTAHAAMAPDASALDHSSSYDSHQSPQSDKSDKSQKSNAPHDMSKCSACAACCVGAAIPSSLDSMLLATESNSEPIPFSLVHFAGHIPPGLERPPRLIVSFA